MTLLRTVSNRELNIWATLVLDVGVAIYYFTSLFGLPENSGFDSAAMAAIIGKIIVFSIIFSIIVFGFINGRGEEKRDERDYRFETRANAIAYYVLVVCMCIVIGHIVLNSVFADFTDMDPNRFLVMLSPMLIANALLFVLLFSSATKALVQLFHYRRG